MYKNNLQLKNKLKNYLKKEWEKNKFKTNSSNRN